MTLINELYEKLNSRYDKMLEIRRHIHEHPEISFHEHDTAKYIADFYMDKITSGVKMRAGVGGLGIIVTIDSENPGRTIALRADFDALPMQEDTGLPFASKVPNVMHSCGHDAHTAYLMILASCLIDMRKKLIGKILIIHQPAEEAPPGGAGLMIKDGALDGVDNIFACHVMSEMEYGKIFYHSGPTQQARAKFIIKIQGVGGHGSSPHEANDAIICASYMVTALQTIISRRKNPFDAGVVTIGSFGGEGTFNIIKDSVILEGDARCMSVDVQRLIQDNIIRIANGIGEAFDCDVDVQYMNDYPVLINDPKMTDLVKQSVADAPIDELTGIEDCGQMPPSEDFAFYTQIIPSCFFYIGAKPRHKKSYPHHHPKFDIEESSMMISAEAMGAVVLRYMGLF